MNQFHLNHVTSIRVTIAKFSCGIGEPAIMRLKCNILHVSVMTEFGPRLAAGCKNFACVALLHMDIGQRCGMSCDILY